MQEKILKLCRRLKKCTLDEVVQFSEFEQNETQKNLDNFVSNGDLVFSEGVYLYCFEPDLKENGQKISALCNNFILILI